MKKISDAVEIMENMIGDYPKLYQMYTEARINAHVAKIIYDARAEALHRKVVIDSKDL